MEDKEKEADVFNKDPVNETQLNDGVKAFGLTYDSVQTLDNPNPLHNTEETQLRYGVETFDLTYQPVQSLGTCNPNSQHDKDEPDTPLEYTIEVIDDAAIVENECPHPPGFASIEGFVQTGTSPSVEANPQIMNFSNINTNSISSEDDLEVTYENNASFEDEGLVIDTSPSLGTNSVRLRHNTGSISIEDGLSQTDTDILANQDKLEDGVALHELINPSQSVDITRQGGYSESGGTTELKKNVSVSYGINEDDINTKYEAPNFDELFANLGRYRPKLKDINKFKESADEGISSSFDRERESPDVDVIINLPEPLTDEEPELRQYSNAPRISRVDSVMEQTFVETLLKGLHSSKGFLGFRRSFANNINHKYCHYCRCDDTVFMFLHVVFGMVCICAGIFGIMECINPGLLIYFMFLEGALSVFVFPILIMGWTKRVGGCVHEDQKLGRGFFFLAVLLLRIVSAAAGTGILLSQESLMKGENSWCLFVITTFLVSVIFEWSFLICVILLPLCWYGGVYVIARTIL